MWNACGIIQHCRNRKFLETTFLEGVLLVLSTTFLLLYINKKDFDATSRAIDSPWKILSNVGDDLDSPNVKSFKQSSAIVKNFVMLGKPITVVSYHTY